MPQPEPPTVASDGLPARPTGAWVHDKKYYLERYLSIFTKGVGRKWNGKLCYVDLFSGPGRSVIRQSVEDGRFSIRTHRSISISARSPHVRRSGTPSRSSRRSNSDTHPAIDCQSSDSVNWFGKGRALARSGRLLEAMSVS